MVGMTAIPRLFRSLIDDAATFPPADTPLPEAVKAHRFHRSAWYDDLVGPFLCRASALDDLGVHVQDEDPLDVAIIVDTGVAGLIESVDAVAGNDRLTLRGVEIPLRGGPLADNTKRTVAALDSALGGPDDDEPAYVEVPRQQGWEAALDVIADAGYRAKLRTGGVDAGAYPSPIELTDFVVACLDKGIAFKFTAGLHRAVRRDTETGQAEHGFLNVLLAVHAALSGAPDDVTTALTLTDTDDVARRIGDLTDDQAVSIRRWLTSYGSCSINEPLDDLVTLTLLPTS